MFSFDFAHPPPSTRNSHISICHNCQLSTSMSSSASNPNTALFGPVLQQLLQAVNIPTDDPNKKACTRCGVKKLKAEFNIKVSNKRNQNNIENSSNISQPQLSAWCRACQDKHKPNRNVKRKRDSDASRAQLASLSS
jgi:hypothetical protein